VEDKEDNKKNSNDDGPRMKKMMQGFFNDDMKKDFKGMKEDATKGLKRSGAVLVAVAFGWIVFISLHSFLWSTSYTFYQNLVITFDSLIVAVLVGIGLIYKVSGLGNMSKKFSKMTEKFTKKDED
jgi:hypothetical protein